MDVARKLAETLWSRLSPAKTVEGNTEEIASFLRGLMGQREAVLKASFDRLQKDFFDLEDQVEKLNGRLKAKDHELASLRARLDRAGDKTHT